MTDRETVDEKFVVNIASEKYVNLLLPRVSELRAKIAGSYKNPDSWPANIVKIRNIIEKDILDAVRDEAKIRASKMNEDQLRRVVEKLLENSSEACLMFVDKV